MERKRKLLVRLETLRFLDQRIPPTHPQHPCPSLILTVAALTSQALLESSPIHARLGTHRNDLVRVWLSANEEGRWKEKQRNQSRKKLIFTLPVPVFLSISHCHMYI
jgi:hypothetical protein